MATFLAWPRGLPRALLLLLVVVVVSLVAMPPARADLAQDKAECANTMIGMATCLTYVQGSAKAPTPDCCAGLDDVNKKDRKCLCLLIEDRDQPDLGITFNATLALSLPTVCHNPAVNITACPMLLNLPPGSKDAEIFLQYGKDQGNGAKTASGGGEASSNATATATTTAPATKSGDSSGVGGRKLMAGSGGLTWTSSSLLLIATTTFLFFGP